MNEIAQKKTNLLRTILVEVGKGYIQIRKQRHSRINQSNQIDKAFDTVAATEHIITQRPKGLLLIIGNFNVPAQGVNRHG